MSKEYKSIVMDDFRSYLIEKIKTFNEEEFNVQLVIFDEVVYNIAKIDRVIKQPVGHLLLVGVSGVGKTTLSWFVSWMNNYEIF